jgi:hypothetical protein
MTALVVYESMFGNTRDVATAIGEGLAAAGPVRVVEVGAFIDGPDGGVVPADVTLLVVGGPTHAFGMSRPGSRRDAEKKYGPTISRTGVREWLDGLKLPKGLAVAAFDTKLSSPLSGSAARGIAQRLRRLGGVLVLPAQDFYAPGTTGLIEGQLDGAQAWGAQLATALAAQG